MLRLLALVSLLTTTALPVGRAFDYFYRSHHLEAQCGQSLGNTQWRGSLAMEHFQRCTLYASYQVVPNPPSAPSGQDQTVTTAALPGNASCPSQGCLPALLAQINRDRAAAGRAPLQFDPTQSAGTASCPGSLGHSRAMAASGEIWHINASYPRQSFPANLCGRFSAGGENVGMASGSEWSALSEIHHLMMSEPYTPGCLDNHHCNLLSANYARIGLAASQRGGVWYLTEDFLGASR